MSATERRNQMSERDELALKLTEHYIDPGYSDVDNGDGCICGEWVSGAMEPGWDDHMAGVAYDAILAAGYTKPRQVTTVEELDALPVGSVVLDPIGLSLHKNGFTGWCASNGAKRIEGEILTEALPATVLYSPAAEHIPNSSAAECPCEGCRECIDTFRPTLPAVSGE